MNCQRGPRAARSPRLHYPRYGGTLGEVRWERWKQFTEDLISIIYAHDDGVIPLVAGFNWAFEQKGVAAASPVEQAGVGYVSHPYPQKTTRPYYEKWNEFFGYVAEK